MSLHRSLAGLLVAATLSAGVLAQAPISLDDGTIFFLVEDALQGARSLAAARITVRSRDGYVTLGGVVAAVEDIATAGRLAARVRGVNGVNNEIRVANRPSRA
ncbi:MAG TPA: BON domain-containing protein [Burkholderiales bacterium]|nr:BON domain-containing protein [Burkholderiales bacterium]